MSISVSPYLAQASGQASIPASSDGQAPSKAAAESDSRMPATPGDSVTLSPDAQNRLNKTMIESAMERILDGVKNSTGPRLVFQPAIGAKLDQSC